jgi:hypothetical protein
MNPDWFAKENTNAKLNTEHCFKSTQSLVVYIKERTVFLKKYKAFIAVENGNVFQNDNNENILYS